MPPAGGDGHGRHAAEGRDPHVVAHLVDLVPDVLLRIKPYRLRPDPELPLGVVPPAPHGAVVHDGGRVPEPGGHVDGLQAGAEVHLREQVSHVAVVVAAVLGVVQAELFLRDGIHRHTAIVVVREC